LGFLLSLSSTAAITKLLSDRGRINAPAGRHAVGMCVAQDLAVVPMILLIPVLAGGDGSVWGAAAGVAKASGFLALAAAIAWFLVPRVLDLVARTRSRELFVLSVIAICLALSVVTAELGLSLALGAFLAGVILGSSEFHHQAVSEVEPFRDTLASLFFLSIGMLFDSSVLLEEPVLISVCVVTAICGKAVLAFVATRVLRLPSKLGWQVALSVAQIGEFGFVLTQVAARTELLDERLERVFLFVAVVSIAVTPALFALGNFLEQRSERDARREYDEAHGLIDHVVIVGFGPVGRALADTLEAADVPYRVVEMNSVTVKQERLAGRPIILGDASRPVVMHALGIERAKLVVIAINDPSATGRVASLARRMAPHVHIIARATYLGEVEQLQRLEVDEVVPQELETSIEIVVRSLRHLLVPDDEVEERVDAVRTRARNS
ncbi:MAG: cation:proton antiporter, partial [Planctomycetes bacterium]|nr:cation:proton antiporter [Planctomycetota bacterium]